LLAVYSANSIDLPSTYNAAVGGAQANAHAIGAR